MDIGKAFTFPLDDEEWVTRMVIGAVLFTLKTIGCRCRLGKCVDCGDISAWSYQTFIGRPLRRHPGEQHCTPP